MPRVKSHGSGKTKRSLEEDGFDTHYDLQPNKRRKEDPLDSTSEVQRKIEAHCKNDEEKENSKAEKYSMTKMKLASSQKERLLIGCHVSAAGGVHNSVENAVNQGARAFAMFLTNQRMWNAKPLEDDVVDQFNTSLTSTNISVDAIVPHGIYLMNCASPDPALLAKSREKLLEEIKRCQRLGIRFYNFHPGSTVGKITRLQGIWNIIESINGVLDATDGVTLVIENMSGQKNTIGGEFEELRDIIKGVNDKDRIGVCLDTCHAFAAGYDIRSPEAYKSTIAKFDEIVGLKYLKAIHLNDSVADLGSHLDRHADIGTGKIGLRGFRNLMNDTRMIDIPMILETPGFQNYDKQIDLLYSLVTT